MSGCLKPNPKNCDSTELNVKHDVNKTLRDQIIIRTKYQTTTQNCKSNKTRPSNAYSLG